MVRKTKRTCEHQETWETPGKVPGLLLLECADCGSWAIDCAAFWTGEGKVTWFPTLAALKKSPKARKARRDS